MHPTNGVGCRVPAVADQRGAAADAALAAALAGLVALLTILLWQEAALAQARAGAAR